MDFIFNYFIPESTEERIIIRPTGKTFASGLAYSYSADFPEELEGIIYEEDYYEMMLTIND